MKLRAALASVALFAGALFATTPIRAQSPANPNANPNVRAILSYIQSLNARTTHRMLTGQWAGYGPSASLSQLQTIYSQTGQWPAYIGVSYTDYTDNGISPAIPNQLATAYWQAGGLVEVDCHFATSPNGGPLNDQTVSLIDCITPGTTANANWVSMMDQVAAGLQQLQQAGVVVMWRPFHEMNVAYFWWGGKPASDFQRFWQYMFNYFTTTKGLNNLIWVYGPNAGDATDTYYPGAQYVDMTGFSAYGNSVDTTSFGGSAPLIALGKPFGFTEFGPYGTSNPPGNYDYTQFLNGASANFPNAVFFMAWNGNWSPAANLNAAGLYQDPRVVTRAQLATDLFLNASRLSNLSVLAHAGPGSQALTLGFSVSGSGSDYLLARADGPSLTTFGVTGVMATPELQVYSGTTLTSTNLAWGGSSSLQTLFTQVGAFPLQSGSADAAVATTLNPGTYSLVISGTGTSTGVVLGELYDASLANPNYAASANSSEAQLVNLSTLSQVNSSGNPLTLGFVISGSAPRRVLIRAIGPSLAQFGVTGAISDPQLSLFQGQNVMLSNDNWSGNADLVTSFNAVGAFSLDPNSKDAALQTTLAPGAYTVQVTGVGGATGTALAEVYELP